MASVSLVRKLHFCVLPFVFTFCLTMVAGLEWNVLEILRPRPGASIDQTILASQQRSVTDEKAVARNKSQNVTLAQARIIHRNSLSSPVRRVNATRLELMGETIVRDEARVRFIQKHITQMVTTTRTSSDHHHHHKVLVPEIQDVEMPLLSGLSFNTGEYLAVLGVGTPKRSAYLIVDTGSDIMWLQCAPCKNCYQQKNDIFDPSTSSTFKVLNCNADMCLKLNVMGCRSNQCVYEANYGDGSFTMGELATDSVTLDHQVVVSSIPLGCGHDNEGTFGSAAGILGLGKGPLSFPNHVDGSGGVFSYCLPDRETESILSSLVFGDAAVGRSDGSYFTPQLRHPHVATYYYLQIMGISVGGNMLTTIPESAFHLDIDGNGGTIIDSGATFTRLQDVAYTAVRDAFRDATQHLKLVPSEMELFDTCYDFTGLSSVRVPTVTFHFQGEVDLRLPPPNYLVVVDNNDKYCFAFVPVSQGPSILGNVQQQGFQIIYDNEHQQIGFYPNQCT